MIIKKKKKDRKKIRLVDVSQLINFVGSKQLNPEWQNIECFKKVILGYISLINQSAFFE